MITMKNLILIVSLILLLACKNEPQQSKYFEGYVEYKVEAVALDTSIRTQQQVKYTGNAMRCYFKNGNYMREYYDSNNIVIQKNLYQATTNSFVYMSRNRPYYYFDQLDDAEDVNSTKDWRIDDSILTKTVIGNKCIGFTGSYRIVGDNPSTIKMTYYYLNTLPFDYSNFKKSTNPYARYFSNRFPSVSLYFIEEAVGEIKTTHAATRVISTPLSDTLFTIPNDKPLIRL